MYVTSLPKLAREINLRLGRGSLASVKEWLALGAPAKTSDGYDVGSWVEWVQANKPAYGGQGQPAPPPNENGELDPPKNWNEELARQRAQMVEVERQQLLKELVPVELMVQEFSTFVVELFSQLEQLEIDIPRLVPEKACNRTKLRDSVRSRVDAARTTGANFLDGLRLTLTQSGTAFDDALTSSDQSSEPATKSGSQKTSTSARKSRRTPASTSSKKGSNTGEGRSAPRKTKRSKKSS